jgi:hypothetical protein
MGVDVIRFEMAGPGDGRHLREILRYIDATQAKRIAVVAKTEGTATINDFGRSLARGAIQDAFADADILRSAAHLIVDEMDWVCTVGNGAHWIESSQITRAELERRVSGTIGEVLARQKVLTKDGVILAIVQGVAICDVALAQRAFENAVARTK